MPLWSSTTWDRTVLYLRNIIDFYGSSEFGYPVIHFNQMRSTNQTVCPRKEMFEYTTEINSSSILNVSHEIYCPCPHKAIKTLDLYSILSSVLFIFANVLYVLHRCAAFWYLLITHLVSSSIFLMGKKSKQKIHRSDQSPK